MILSMYVMYVCSIYVCSMYVCMNCCMHVCMYIRSSLKVDWHQPGMVANPARGQLNRENDYFPIPVRPENVVSRDGFGRPVPRQPAYSPHSG